MSDTYRFGPFTLDPTRRALTRDGDDISVTPKAFEILWYLVQHPNRVVSKQELMKAVWPDTVVEEGNLTQNISLLRKALTEQGEDRLIVTVARQGYQFTGNVTIEAPPAVESPAARPTPPRRWRMPAGVAVLLVLIGVIFVWKTRSAGGASGPVRLAVLPFENLTGSPAQDYLADGLTEELISQLARLQPGELGVIARTSVMHYKHTDKRIDEIGRDLSVHYAIESSLRQSADRLRVTVQLIRVSDQSHIWANDFDYGTQDILAIEDSVAGAVSHEVRIHLTPAVQATTRSAAITPAAVDAMLRGRDVVRYGQGTKDDWDHAKHYFEQAIAIDSTYAVPWVYMSDIVRKGADRGWMPVDEGDRLAHVYAQRAVSLDPNLPEAYAQLGKIQSLIDWDWAGATESYRRELALDPGSVQALSDAAEIAETFGHLDEAIALSKRASELDPLDPGPRANIAQMLHAQGHVDEAEKIYERDSAALRSPILEEKLVEMYLSQGRLNDAVTLADRIESPPWQGYARALIYVRQGRQHTADSMLTDYVARYGTFASFQIATVYAYRNQKDSALAWLDRSYAQHDQGLNSMKYEPLFDNLKGDPRYAAFLTKLKLPVTP